MATYVASPRFVVDAIFGLTHITQNLLAPLSNTRYGAEVLGIPNTNLGPLPTAGGGPPFNFSTGALNRFGHCYPSPVYYETLFPFTRNTPLLTRNPTLPFGFNVSHNHI